MSGGFADVVDRAIRLNEGNNAINHTRASRRTSITNFKFIDCIIDCCTQLLVVSVSSASIRLRASFIIPNKYASQKSLIQSFVRVCRTPPTSLTPPEINFSRLVFAAGPFRFWWVVNRRYPFVQWHLKHVDYLLDGLEVRLIAESASNGLQRCFG